MPASRAIASALASAYPARAKTAAAASSRRVRCTDCLTSRGGACLPRGTVARSAMRPSVVAVRVHQRRPGTIHPAMEANVASASGRGALRGLTARPPAALRDALGALLASRLLVWAAGVTAFAVHGARDSRVPHLGTVADALAAPVSRW